MKRNLKSLGLLAFAAFAMSAMFASAASAQKGIFTAGDTSPLKHTGATITGEQYGSLTENYFEAPSGSGERTTCDEALFTGTSETGTETQITISPDYLKCQAASQAATVTMNGCDYVFTQPETAEDVPAGSYTGKVDLTCPVTGGVTHDRIIIHVYGFGSSTSASHFFNVCTIEVWPNSAKVVNGHTTQELGGHVVYTPKVKEIEGVKYDDLTVKATVTEITFKDGCHGGTEDSTGVYNSTVTMTAKTDTGASHTFIDAWISEVE